jgi:hypothetical protein
VIERLDFLAIQYAKVSPSQTGAFVIRSAKPRSQVADGHASWRLCRAPQPRIGSAACAVVPMALQVGALFQRRGLRTTETSNNLPHFHAIAHLLGTSAQAPRGVAAVQFQCSRVRCHRSNPENCKRGHRSQCSPGCSADAKFALTAPFEDDLWNRGRQEGVRLRAGALVGQPRRRCRYRTGAFHDSRARDLSEIVE